MKRFPGRPKGCDNEPLETACLKKLKNCFKNGSGTCLNCNVKGIEKHKR